MKNANSTSAFPKRRRRGARITLIVFVVIFVFLVVFLSVECNMHALGVKQGTLNRNYATVLGNIDGIVDTNPRLSQIAMLGAHDATSYNIGKDSELDDAAKQTVLGKLAPITHGMQARFAKTQTVGLYDQLMQGARYLHMKYAFDNGEWYGTHSMLSNKLSEDVVDVLRFLVEGKGEVVVLVFHATYFGGESYESFHKWIAEISYQGKTLYDFVNFGNAADFDIDNDGVGAGELRYNQLTNSAQSNGVVLFDMWDDNFTEPYQADAEYTSKYFFNFQSNGMDIWHNQSASKRLIKSIGEAAKECDSVENKNAILRVNQTQAAFAFSSFDDALTTLFGQSLLKIASKHNPKLLENADFDKWLEAMPIFQVDFVTSDYDDFNTKANEKIRAYNIRLCAGV